MKVTVIIEKGVIARVEVTEDKSTPRFSTQVVARLPENIREANSVDVESVSGATLSSNSLKKAVTAALEKAKN